MTYKNIVFEVDNGIGHIEINRPEVRNAMNRATRKEMIHALETVEQDSGIKVLILSGKGGKAFIAGSDLSELAQYSPLEMEAFMAELAQGFYTRFQKLDKPVIAMIDGYCLGGGLELALACDIRIASDRSTLGLPEINLGIIPGGGGTQRLTSQVGMGKAKEMIFTGALIDAREAKQLGLLNQVYPAEELPEQVMRMAKLIAQKSALALKWAKRCINTSAEVGLDNGLAYEALAECLMFSSQDRQEGFKAITEKRRPVFKGR